MKRVGATRAQIRAAISEFEMPIPDPWRVTMRKARKALKMSQGELGTIVDLSQFSVSQIETGKAKHSKYLFSIALALGIRPPEYPVNDPRLAMWLAAGEELLRDEPQLFEHYVAIMAARRGAGPKSG